MKNNRRTAVKKGLTPAIMLVVMVLTSSCLFAQNDKGKLLYKGEYIETSSIMNGVSVQPLNGHFYWEVTIYEDRIEDNLGQGTFYFKGITSDGKRKYGDGCTYNAYYLVDGNYNITYYSPDFSNNIVRNKKKESSVSDGNYGGGGTGTYTGGNSGNDGNKGNTTTTQPKRHKCGVCGGTGREIRTDAVSFGKTKYCSECGKTVPDYHYHAPCRSCGGKGWW